MTPTVEVLKQLAAQADSYSLSFETLPAGALWFEKTGECLPTASVTAAKNCDAILLSAMGLPHIRKADGTEMVPQIDLRMELNLFAGVRPVFTFENGRLFAHKDEGVVVENEYATEQLRITREVSEKLFDFSFRLAQTRAKLLKRPSQLMCVDKANVFRSFWFFREIFEQRAASFPDVETTAMYVDAAAMKMVQSPWELDVMVTENMFGDILSDLGAGLMGSLGLAPSADIGLDNAVFQPCHGSAPDIAGQGVANPMAMILSAAMMLEWLGETHHCDEASQNGLKLRTAATKAAAKPEGRGRDLGGSADTDSIAQAVMDAL